MNGTEKQVLILARIGDIVFQRGRARSQWAVQTASAVAGLGHSAVLMGQAPPLRYDVTTSEGRSKLVRFLNDFYGADHDFDIAVSPETKPDAQQLEPFEIDYLAETLPNFSYAHIRDPRVIPQLVKLDIPFCYEDHNELHNLQITQDALDGLRSDACRMICAITEAVAKRLVAYGLPENRIKVLDSGVQVPTAPHDPVRLARWRNFLLDGRYKHIAVYGGGLQKERGVFQILNAAAVMPDVVFVVAGGNARDQAAFRELRDELDITNVKIAEFMKRRDFMELCQASDATILTRNGTYRDQISSPLKLFEYLASGAPVVALKTKPVAQVVTKKLACTTFEQANAASLVAALQSSFKKWPKKPGGYSQNIERAQQFDWESRQRKIMATLLDTPA